MRNESIPTPRADEAESTFNSGLPIYGNGWNIARQLERETIQLKAEREQRMLELKLIEHILDGDEGWQEAVKDILQCPAMQSAIQLRQELDEANKSIQIKGIFICDKCNFSFTKQNLYVKTGTIGMDESPFVERCPNDGQIMRPLTYKELAEQNYKGACNQVERAIKAEQERDQLKAQLAEAQKGKENILQLATNLAMELNDELIGEYGYKKQSNALNAFNAAIKGEAK